MSMPIKKEIYGNMEVYHPDGTLMFRCDEKRSNWYLNRNLAVKINDNAIQLTFVPKGKGHIKEPYYLVKKDNKCVVCGCIENLTRHHAVPIGFRRHFPDNLKSRCSHDIVALCVDCHEKYEIHANKLKRELMENAGIIPKMKNSEEWKKVNLLKKIKGIAKTLFENYDKIPADRKQHLFGCLNEYAGTCLNCKEDLDSILAIPEEQISRRTKMDCSTSKLYVSKIENIEEFIRMWRQHFVSTMQPNFLPAHWDVNHRLTSNG